MNNLRTCPVILLLICSISHYAEAFISPFTTRQYNPLTTLQASVAVSNDVKGQVSVIKRVLAKEYTFTACSSIRRADGAVFCHRTSHGHREA